MAESTKSLYKQLEGGQIRIIRLTGTCLVDIDDHDPHQDLAITCQMEPVSLGDVEAGKKSYYALSYCWGSQHHRRHVVCNGITVPVTRNLYNALWHCLIDRDEHSHTLWIDAICINQSDNTERGQQVALMRQIYTQAESVLVWLGTGDDVGAAEVHDYWVWLAGGALPEQKPSERAVEIGQDYILRSSWFRRAWTFQEIVLPRHAVVRCGMYSFGWNVLSSQPAFEPLIGGIEGLRQTSRLANLTSLLKLTQNRKSTDPRDRLYALLGMYHRPDTLRADYSKSLQEVLKIIADVIIHEESNLSVLGLANVPVLHMSSVGEYLIAKPKPIKIIPEKGEEKRTMLMLGYESDYEEGDHYEVELPMDLRKYVESVDTTAVTEQSLKQWKQGRGEHWHPDFPDLSHADVLEYLHDTDVYEVTYKFRRIHRDFRPSFHDRGGHLIVRGLILGRWVPLQRHPREKIWRKPNPGLFEVVWREHFDKSKSTGIMIPLPPCVEAALSASRVPKPDRGMDVPPDQPALEEAEIPKLSELSNTHDAHKCACDKTEWPVLAELVQPEALQCFVFMPFGATAPVIVQPDCYDSEGLQTVRLVARCKDLDAVNWPLCHAAYDPNDPEAVKSLQRADEKVNLSCVLVNLEIVNQTAEMPASGYPGKALSGTEGTDDVMKAQEQRLKQLSIKAS